MKREIMAKIMAILALIGISVGVLGTGFLAIFGDKYSENNQSNKAINEADLQKMIDDGKVKISESGATENNTESTLLEDVTGSGEVSEINTGSNSTGEIKK